MRICVFKVLILLVVSAKLPLFSNNPLNDPLIRNGETAKYIIATGKDENYTTYSVSIVEEGNKPVYKIVSKSDNKKVEIKLLKNTMKQFYFSSVAENAGYSIETQKSVEYKTGNLEDEIQVLDMTSLMYSLRGFPFKNPKPLKITVLTDNPENMGDYMIMIKLLHKEKREVNNKKIECYKLEMYITGMGLLDVFMPKTYFWYSVESPHYLVRYEGSQGPPGSPNRIMELVEYYMGKK